MGHLPTDAKQSALRCVRARAGLGAAFFGLVGVEGAGTFFNIPVLRKAFQACLPFAFSLLSYQHYRMF